MAETEREIFKGAEGGKDNNKKVSQDPSGEDALDFIGRQIIISDPQYQGYGLQGSDRMSLYANKFFILSDPKGLYITPAEVPDALLEYYDKLQLRVGSPTTLLALPDKKDVSVIQHLMNIPAVIEFLADHEGKFLVPYMITEEAEQLATATGLPLLGNLEKVTQVANKVPFQEALGEMADEIEQEFGYNVAIEHRVSTSDNVSELLKVYLDLTRNGKEDIVIVKPESAAGKGVFFVESKIGFNGFMDVIDEEFAPGEQVLLEKAIDHSFSPSMQGAKTPTGAYQHYYFGRQNITVEYIDGVGVNNYDSNSLPFGPTEHIPARDLEVLQLIHELIAEKLITAQGLAGICGLDSVIQTDADNHISQVKFTEANLHFPGSIATFTAMRKLFPDGFTGIAYNEKIPYGEGQDFKSFMKKNRSLLIKKKGEFGIFPIVANYPGAVDIIVFARDVKHQQKLLGSIKS